MRRMRLCSSGIGACPLRPRLGGKLGGRQLLVGDRVGRKVSPGAVVLNPVVGLGNEAVFGTRPDHLGGSPGSPDDGDRAWGWTWLFGRCGPLGPRRGDEEMRRHRRDRRRGGRRCTCGHRRGWTRRAYICRACRRHREQDRDYTERRGLPQPPARAARRRERGREDEKQVQRETTFRSLMLRVSLEELPTSRKGPPLHTMICVKT